MIRYFLIYLLLINAAGFIMMGLDKRFAKMEGMRRIPEKTLLTIAFIGGSVGSYLGMKQFHHKTLHNRFRYGIPAMIILHLLLAAWYLYKNGFSFQI